MYISDYMCYQHIITAMKQPAGDKAFITLGINNLAHCKYWDSYLEAVMQYITFKHISCWF